KPKLRSNTSRWLKPLVSITCALILSFSFVVDLGMVPTASMEGTVLVGDHLLMLKLPYGPHIPFTRIRLPRYRTPQPGEIVAFPGPLGPGEIYLKRVIAGAGDVVALHGGVLYVNGIRWRESYARVRPSRRWSWQENIGPYRVPAGSLFVLGDNRDNSEDS